MPALTLNELDRLTQELASLSRSDIPLPQGLRHLSQSLESGRLRTVAAESADELERGKSLADALAASSIQVPASYLALVRCAETTGDSRSLLEFAAEHSRRLRIHHAALATALLYPLLLTIGVMLLLTLLANTLVLEFFDIYAQLGAELPALTLLILNILRIFQGPGGIALALLLIGALVFVAATPHMRDRAFQMMNWVPGARSLTQLSDAGLVMKFLSVALKYGAPLPMALEAAELAVAEGRTRRHLRQMSEAAERGQPTAPHLSPGTPATAAYLYEQGEQRGDLAAACGGIADYCEARFDRLSRRTAALFEPLMVLGIGVFMAIMLISLYLPLFSIPKVVR
ncbi:MAG: type II secretion system F family protein [Sumerlaeia bacterium]